MKKIKYLVLPLIGLSLSSCTSYASHYKAFLLVTSQKTSEGKISFDEFDGQYVFNLKKTSDGEGDIKYHGFLGKGHIDVFYVDPITKQENSLFTISSGELIDSHKGYVEKGYKVKIVLRSESKALDGNFTFNVN